MCVVAGRRDDVATQCCAERVGGSERLKVSWPQDDDLAMCYVLCHDELFHWCQRQQMGRTQTTVDVHERVRRHMLSVQRSFTLLAASHVHLVGVNTYDVPRAKIADDTIVVARLQ